MIRVHIEQHRDFGREMRMAIIETLTTQSFDGSIQHEEYVLVPNPDPASTRMARLPLVEGEMIRPEQYFIRVNQLFAEEFLRALTTELARLGYSNPDPFDYRSKALDQHIKTLDAENQRKHELLNRVLGIVERSVEKDA